MSVIYFRNYFTFMKGTFKMRTMQRTILILFTREFVRVSYFNMQQINNNLKKILILRSWITAALFVSTLYLNIQVNVKILFVHMEFPCH